MPNGDLIIIKQTQPGSQEVYGLIGGRVEQDESPEAAALRELREEAGMTAGKLRLIESFQFLPKIDWAIYIFIASGVSSTEANALDGGEKIEALPLQFDQLLDLMATDQFGDVEVALRFLRRCHCPNSRAQFFAAFQNDVEDFPDSRKSAAP